MKANSMLEIKEFGSHIGTAWDYEPSDWCNWSPLQFYFVKNKDVGRK